MAEGETTTLYEAIGGDEAVKALTERFYVLMDTLPEAARCRALHPDDLTGSREKLYLYLTGWLGGPPVYVERYGHPMLRRAISAPRSARRRWRNGCSALIAHWTKP